MTIIIVMTRDPSPSLERHFFACSHLRCEDWLRMFWLLAMGRGLEHVARWCKVKKETLQGMIRDPWFSGLRDDLRVMPPNCLHRPGVKPVAALSMFRERLERLVEGVFEVGAGDPYVQLWCRWVRNVLKMDPVTKLLDDLERSLSRGIGRPQKPDTPSRPRNRRPWPKTGPLRLEAEFSRLMSNISLELRRALIWRFFESRTGAYDFAWFCVGHGRLPRTRAGIDQHTATLDALEAGAPGDASTGMAAPSPVPESAPSVAARPEMEPRGRLPD